MTKDSLFILREVTPLSKKDCFMVFSRRKRHFAFPIHVHAEFELNFIENGAGARRVVGDSIEEIGNLELVLIARSDLEHAWLNHECNSEEIREITIQFHDNLLSENLLQKNQFCSIKEMFEKAAYGIVFPARIVKEVKDNLYSLASEPEGVYSVLKFLGILYDLSLSPMRELSSHSFSAHRKSYNSQRVERAYNFMLENYNKEIHLGDVADLVGMTDVAFSRFIKQRTGCNFIDSLNDIRLGHATRMLVDTTYSISEISLVCGFNNLSNFNRIFKKKKRCTPSKFRENYKESKYFI
ncbi:MAG: AraC family transcriptional regulator [Prevotella sp.]|jgi:AraC-like DNA-binding protein|nr:AraC family transcriptional regulator [Prevotella sp.]